MSTYDKLENSIFYAVSFLTTTGFSTVNYADWGNASLIIHLVPTPSLVIDQATLVHIKQAKELQAILHVMGSVPKFDPVKHPKQPTKDA